MNEARDQVADRLTTALCRDLGAALDIQFRRGRRNAELAMFEHGKRAAAQALPATCPNELEQIFDPDWYPANRRGLVDDIKGDAS